LAKKILSKKVLVKKSHEISLLHSKNKFIPADLKNMVIKARLQIQVIKNV